DEGGTATLRQATDEGLSGRVGLVGIVAGREVVGELELVPDKLSEPAYEAIRAELQRVWTDLVLDPEAPTAVRAAPPSARELWRRLDEPIRRILAHPNEQLVIGTAPRRTERARRPREPQARVVRAGSRARPA